MAADAPLLSGRACRRMPLRSRPLSICREQEGRFMGARLQSVRHHSWLVIGVFAMLLPAAAGAAEPIASTDSEQPGIRLDVTELKRTSGDTLMLKFTIVNEADERLGFGHDFGDPQQSSDYGTVGGIHLVDAG